MRSPEPGALPPIFAGARRGWVLGLVGLGLGQGALGAVSAWALTQLRGGGSWPVAAVILSIVAAAVALGGLRVEERIAAERLGQDYVRHVRRDLVEAELTPGSRTHLGITVARTTNDLSSVRNWVSQGVGPLAAGIPLIVGSAVVLTVIDPFLGLGFLFPLGVLAAVLVPWARTAYQKSRRLRRARGRMATRIADTVGAAQGIIAARGTDRELGHIDTASDTVVDRAVDRSEIVGLIRAGGTVAAMLATLAVAAIGVLRGLDPAVTMAAMAVAGIASTPIIDIGRIVEYRQTYLAARAVLGPALADAARRRTEYERSRDAAASAPVPDGAAGPGRVHVAVPGLTPDGSPLRAVAGARIRLTSADPEAPLRLMRRVVGLDAAPPRLVDAVWVGGENLGAVAPARGRALVGLATRGAVFERGPLRRALRYRRPDLDNETALTVLETVGLAVDRLPDGPRTVLRSGGEPLTTDARARLALARAIYGEPPLLLVADLDRDLDQEGRDRLERLLAGYPGVVVLTGSDELARSLGTEEFRLDPTPVPLTPTGRPPADD
ncbi:ABC transporter transmembrane domain-containing protein [Promicromonospora iranensis]|uniref:ABC-type multidrug transport system fused ATPase/permease subunit n=1 Tax=Promicromonospora iranensis TaxID=1105144 RepID=A0ABU2CMY3_9MICO|nr:ABC transporter transmembrane domain-containing protein [Promicromonospora iranensis]MDR7382701.1 ABC-type multidrug transport system fused ATPase/permease subunit [Promicromonospora iranensis]